MSILSSGASLLSESNHGGDAEGFLFNGNNNADEVSSVVSSASLARRLSSIILSNNNDNNNHCEENNSIATTTTKPRSSTSSVVSDAESLMKAPDAPHQLMDEIHVRIRGERNRMRDRLRQLHKQQEREAQQEEQQKQQQKHQRRHTLVLPPSLSSFRGGFGGDRFGGVLDGDEVSSLGGDDDSRCTQKLLDQIYKLRRQLKAKTEECNQLKHELRQIRVYQQSNSVPNVESSETGGEKGEETIHFTPDVHNGFSATSTTTTTTHHINTNHQHPEEQLLTTTTTVTERQRVSSSSSLSSSSFYSSFLQQQAMMPPSATIPEIDEEEEELAHGSDHHSEFGTAGAAASSSSSWRPRLGNLKRTLPPWEKWRNLPHRNNSANTDATSSFTQISQDQSATTNRSTVGSHPGFRWMGSAAGRVPPQSSVPPATANHTNTTKQPPLSALSQPPFRVSGLPQHDPSRRLFGTAASRTGLQLGTLASLPPTQATPPPPAAVPSDDASTASTESRFSLPPLWGRVSHF